MCGRLSLFVPADDLGGRFNVSVPETYSPSYNVAPTDDVATIRDDSRDAIELVRWGLVPRWADDPNDWNQFNARAETLTEKPAFRNAATKSDTEGSGRCLVLADGFYEWQDRTDGTQPFRIHRSDDEPFAMAGLYDRWKGENGDGNGSDSLTTVTIVTTEPNDLMAELHHRMPVVLSQNEEQAWLDHGPDRSELLAPRPWKGFESYPVSSVVGDSSFDDPSVIEPIDAPSTDPQTGLDEFGG